MYIWDSLIAKFSPGEIVMWGKRDLQDNFFDSYIQEYFLPQEHELLQIKEKVDFSFIQDKDSRPLRQEYGKILSSPRGNV